MQAVSNHFGKTADVHQPVEFDTDGKISLDISEDDINSRGWTIIPTTNPVVRARVRTWRRVKLCLSVCPILFKYRLVKATKDSAQTWDRCYIRQDCFIIKLFHLQLIDSTPFEFTL